MSIYRTQSLLTSNNNTTTNTGWRRQPILLYVLCALAWLWWHWNLGRNNYGSWVN